MRGCRFGLRRRASLDGEVYVFGGGQFSSYDHILRYEPGNGRVSLVGQLVRLD
jgi:hypothetical protein